MSISFNQLNGTTVSDASGNTTLGTFSLQGAEFQRGLNNRDAVRCNTMTHRHITTLRLD